MKLTMSARMMLALVLGTLVLPAGAAIRHSDVSLQTYVDFATNSGRYAVGTTNALLDHIRLRDGGVRIKYTESSGKSETPYTLPHEMISFDSVSDMGNMTLVGYNYAVSAAHNSSAMTATFTRNDYGVGVANSQRYRAVEEYGVTADGKADYTFVHHIYSGQQDYKLSRLTKLVTDATPAQMAGGSGSDYKGELVYRVGGGQQCLRNGDTISDSTSKDVYTVAGIAGVQIWSQTPDDIRQATVVGTTSWEQGEGAGEGTPLPFGSTPGDSGSPYFVWEDGTYKFLSTHHGSTNENRQTLSCEARGWTQEIMRNDSFIVDMSTVKGALVIDGADAPEKEDANGMTGSVNGVEFTATAAQGWLRSENGNLYDNNGQTSFRAVATGQHTWSSLSDLKDTDAWFAYYEIAQDEKKGYLNVTDSVVVENKVVTVAEGITWARLFQTQNLVFEAAADTSSYTINVTRDTDLGAGYLHFAANGKKNVVFDVNPAGSNQLNSAGYVVDAGVQVNVSLCNANTNYMREWRKVGEGTLNICGNGGNNEIFLNVGGKGETLLNQEKGYYAAYNVLVNTGSTVKIADTGQIFRDLTFGNGGGTLDMNGQSMAWYLTDGEKKDGFTINALTEEAVISNSAKEHSSLVFSETGSQKFVGSFSDSDGQSSLGITYDGGGTWELNGIRTSLTNAKSGLTVQNGTVKLGGTLTVHGYGTTHTSYGDGDTADFSTRANDWHYADATMNVTVKDKAVFELESHARLIGTVTVESGGKYIMHEGVQNAQEYIEGGEKLEDTAAIKAYYGHKGDVKLAKEATLSWQRGSKEVANLVGATDAGALTGVESTISAEDRLRLAASDKDKLGHIAASQLTLQGGVTLELDKVYLAADSAITSYSSASVSMSNVTLQLTEANTETLSQADLGAALDLKAYQAGDSLTLQSGLKVLELQADSLGGVLELKGENITLDMTALNLSGVNAVKISFAEGVTLADSLAVTALTADDTLGGYYATNEAGSVYFVVSVPEPATATLSLLALAGFMARRRRG